MMSVADPGGLGGLTPPRGSPPLSVGGLYENPADRPPPPRRIPAQNPPPPPLEEFLDPPLNVVPRI